MNPGPRFLLISLFAVSSAGCGDRPARQSDVTPADIVAGRVQTFEQFESANGRFAMDLPPSWRGAYHAVERNDTSFGARLTVEFVFRPDPAWKVEPRTLLVVRVFPKAAWEKVAARPGDPVAAKVAERGDEVWAFSYPASNPYKPGTPAALRYDTLVFAVMQPKEQMRFTPR